MALFDNCTNGSSWLHNFDPKKQIIWPSSIIVQMVPVGCITLILKSRESYRDYMALFDNCTNGSSWLHKTCTDPELILQKSNGQFQRNRIFFKVPEGVQQFPGGVQLLILYRNPIPYITCDFPGGGPDPLPPPPPPPLWIRTCKSRESYRDNNLYCPTVTSCFVY